MSKDNIPRYFVQIIELIRIIASCMVMEQKNYNLKQFQDKTWTLMNARAGLDSPFPLIYVFSILTQRRSSENHQGHFRNPWNAFYNLSHFALTCTLQSKFYKLRIWNMVCILYYLRKRMTLFLSM